MEDDWFLPDVGGQPLQKFFECHMEEANRCAQQPSKGPQKTDTSRDFWSFICEREPCQPSTTVPELN